MLINQVNQNNFNGSVPYSSVDHLCNIIMYKQAVFLWEYFKASYFWMCFLCRHLVQNLFWLLIKLLQNCPQDISGILNFDFKAETHTITRFFQSQCIILPSQAGHPECCANSSASLSEIMIWLTNYSGLAPPLRHVKKWKQNKSQKSQNVSSFLFMFEISIKLCSKM